MPNQAFRIHSYGGPQVAGFDDVPPQGHPDSGHAVVSVKAVGVNQLDWKVREGYLREVFPLDLPAVIGVEFAGTVESIGQGVSGISAGDRVMGFLPELGSFTQSLLIDAALLARTPSGLTDIDAAAIPVAATTAWQALYAAGPLEGSPAVLVHGAAGGLGGWVVQFAKLAGAQVIATAGIQDHSYVRELGADRVIDYRNESFDDQLSGIDLVIDLVGGPTLDRSWKVVKRGGAVVSTADPRVVGAVEGTRGIWPDVQPDTRQLQQIADDVADSRLVSRVARVFPRGELGGAIELNRAGGYGPGKIVVDFDD